MQGPDASTLNLHGQTVAKFHSSWTLVNRRVEPVSECECPPEQQCSRVIGVVRSRFRASVTSRMPAMPSGLTAAERRQVQVFLNTVLFGHEHEHRARLQSYDGVVDTPVELTGCWPGAVRAMLQNLHDSLDERRQDAALALSAQLDR